MSFDGKDRRDVALLYVVHMASVGRAARFTWERCADETWNILRRLANA